MSAATAWSRFDPEIGGAGGGGGFAATRGTGFPQVHTIADPRGECEQCDTSRAPIHNVIFNLGHDAVDYANHVVDNWLPYLLRFTPPEFKELETLGLDVVELEQLYGPTWWVGAQMVAPIATTDPEIPDVMTTWNRVKLQRWRRWHGQTLLEVVIQGIRGRGHDWNALSNGDKEQRFGHVVTAMFFAMWYSTDEAAGATFPDVQRCRDPQNALIIALRDTDAGTHSADWVG
jgi:hypothetical protein